MKRKTIKRRLKIKKVPAEVQSFVIDSSKALPEPVVALVEAVKEGKVEELVLVDPDPTLWERFCNWFSD